MPVNSQPEARPRDQVVAMALVAQVNALQLLLAAHKRQLTDAPRLASPGAVRDFREALIDWRTIKSYSDRELMLRTHQVWGQHCLFCWAFYCIDPHAPPPFGDLEPEHQMRCGRELSAKLEHLLTEMKTLRQESLRRSDARPPAVISEGPSGAKTAPNVEQACQEWSDAELLARTCEYAGMLAAARWMADAAWRWDDPEIMNPDAASPGGR